jgi:hypothetical protein
LISLWSVMGVAQRARRARRHIDRLPEAIGSGSG